MRHQRVKHQNQLEYLLNQYEVMSQKNTACFYEEAVFVEVIDYLESDGQWHKATAIVEVAIAQHPFSPDLYLRKAELLLNRNMVEECLVTIAQAEIFAPCNVNLNLLRAELVAAKGSFVEAFAILDQLKPKANAEEMSEIYLTEAIIHEDLRNKNAMFKALRLCLLSNPENTEGYQKLMLLVEKCRFYSQSIEFHNKLIDRNAFNWLAWLNLGMALRGVGKNNAAVEAYEFAFAINEECLMAYMEAGETLLELGEYERAKLVYEVAIFNTTENADLLLQLGNCYQLLNNHKAAIGFYERVVEFDKMNSEAYYNIGESAKILQQWQKSIDAYKKAIKLEGQKEDYHAGLADAYFQNNQLSDALFSYRRAANIGFDDVTYWLRYAYFLLNIGQVKTALKVLEKADMYAGGTEIEYCRIACLYMMGKRSEALYKLSEALQCDYETHKTLFSWQPELAKKEDLQAVIMAFLP